MFALYIFSFVLLQFALAAPQQPGTPGGRIVGGDAADIRKYPYQASIHYSGEYRCGGAIISRTWILTAAQCIDGVTFASSLIAVVGSSYRNLGGQTPLVGGYRAHPSYSSNTGDYDIALIHLQQKISLDDHAQIIKLPDNEEIDIEGQLANVTGWGATKEGGNLSDFLQVIEIPIINHAVCKDVPTSYPITDRMLCAGLWDGSKDACNGDRGSPLVINGTLYGIASWRVGCARPDRPGVYTNVAFFRDWITNETGI